MDIFSKAIKLRESGQHEEAKSIFFDLLKLEPHNPSIWYQIAWVHDVMELEREAVPFYLKSIELGLAGEERQGALLGLGSTYRTLGMYEESKKVFVEAINEFPERREFQVFYAMVLYNLKEYDKAMEILLKQLSETSDDEGIHTYKNAILFYADKLDRLWN
ncbi:tetratricopeptide repeat protein [Paenibacillus sp. sptzw28]|uniref:tetratricopeptide repeat protein n=1 Tax=Paenibacillus sp. sptzw28 TaxID=715179 RepID=UPI0037CA49EC